MKKLVFILALAFLGAGPARLLAETSVEKDPAYLAIDQAIDLKAIRPGVNVNLPRFLLQDALSDLNGGTNDPLAKTGINLADLVKDVKLIRLVIIEASKTNRDAVEKGVAALRATLDSKWTPVAVLPDENIGIYALGDPSGESMAGLAVLVHDGGDTIIANIVGRVSLGKIIKIASNMNKIPKDLLKKLASAGGPADDKKGDKPVDKSVPEPPPVQKEEKAAK
ncbi:MAG TPA: DUF4252 domain-containing protein [Verrucomicrobiae bacterium]|nr:DUF4252 domain-containing protein [Verrucomicrobiae bacterium]